MPLDPLAEHMADGVMEWMRTDGDILGHKAEGDEQIGLTQIIIRLSRNPLPTPPHQTPPPSLTSLDSHRHWHGHFVSCVRSFGERSRNVSEKWGKKALKFEQIAERPPRLRCL